jgi:hypothetical protein
VSGRVPNLLLLPFGPSRGNKREAGKWWRGANELAGRPVTNSQQRSCACAGQQQAEAGTIITGRPVVAQGIALLFLAGRCPFRAYGRRRRRLWVFFAHEPWLVGWLTVEWLGDFVASLLRPFTTLTCPPPDHWTSFSPAAAHKQRQKQKMPKTRTSPNFPILDTFRIWIHDGKRKYCNYREPSDMGEVLCRVQKVQPEKG